MNRLTIASMTLLAILGSLGAAGYYLTHNVDWTRVYYKRLKAENVYVFDKIAPRLKETDPAKLIRIRSPRNADQIRNDLIDAIWGPTGLPRKALPTPKSGSAPDGLRAIAGVAEIRQWRIPVDIGYAAYIYLLRPVKSNGRLVIYQHGYAGTVDAMAPLFQRLVEQGYSVAASNYPEYGPNRFPRQNLERFGWYNFSHDRIVGVHPRPMLFYIEPIIVLLNGVHNELNFSRVDMLGFSAGGWIATVAAAVDRRISQTITVAGGYPLYLRLKIRTGVAAAANVPTASSGGELS